MNPLSNADIVSQSDPTLKAAPRPKPPRPSSPTPALPSVQGKLATPTFLHLKLTAIKGSGESDNQDTPPGSPSSRAKARVHRSITEAGGKKRALDGQDGPGAGLTGVAKRHKKSARSDSPGEATALPKADATPPGSPRAGTGAPAQDSPPSSPRGRTDSPKQLVRQAKAVQDFKKLGSISPRRPDVSSAPNSPRAVTVDDQPDPRRSPAADTSTASTGGVKTASTGWAPEFNSISSPELMTFTFTECDFGQGGELVPAKVSPSDTSANSENLAATLIKAELLLKAEVQKAAVASCIAAHRVKPAGLDAGSGAQAADAVLDTLRRAQDSLDADLVLFEMALEQEAGSTAATYLKNVGARLAELRNALETLPIPATDDNARISAHHALTESLAQMDDACRMWMGMLAGEPAHRQPERQPLPLTQSKQTLLNDLDELMDKVIGAQ